MFANKQSSVKANASGHSVPVSGGECHRQQHECRRGLVIAWYLSHHPRYFVMYSLTIFRAYHQIGSDHRFA